MLEFHPVAHGNIKEASGETGLAIWNFPWIYLDFGDSSPRSDIGD
jgi:hypothetical protein